MKFFDGLCRLLRFGPRPSPVQGERTPSSTVGDSLHPADGARHVELCRNAIQCCERGDFDAAVRMLQEAIALKYDFADAHFVLGQIYQRRGQLDDASDCYVLATHFRADLQEAYLKLGLLALDQSRFDEAQFHLEKAIALNAEDAEAHNGLGVALLNRGHAEEAVAHFQRALVVRPDFARAHSNLGHVLFRDFERFEEGAEHSKTALQLAPDDTDVQSNWTMVLEHYGHYSEALALCNRLIERDPELNEARLNRALILLKMGEFRSAWPDYEARKLTRSNYTPRPYVFPEWCGEPLTGKTVLVYAEQGLGDEIMFASCLPDLIARAGRCVLECAPRLERLLRRSFPGATLHGAEQSDVDTSWLAQVGPIDYQVALGSLPGFFRRQWSDFPPNAGYLRADSARVEHWRGRLRTLGTGPRIGISWRGGVTSTRRQLRSMQLSELWPLVQRKDAVFVSLQYGECRAEIEALLQSAGVRVHHWQEAIDDYDETAALVSALDLVISVQTAIVHLTGALGKPAWVMVPAVPEWRYLDRGEAMPWYPSVGLYRQARLGDWQPVIRRISEELEILTAAP